MRWARQCRSGSKKKSEPPPSSAKPNRSCARNRLSASSRTFKTRGTMTRTTRIFAGAALLLLTLVAGCATPKKAAQPVVEKDISRVIKLGDGTICVEPAGLGETRQAAGAVQLRELLESDAKADEALTKARALNLKSEEVEAVYFDACRAYSNGAIKQEAFEEDRTVYLGLRRQPCAQGVKQWQYKDEGIA